MDKKSNILQHKIFVIADENINFESNGKILPVLIYFVLL
jgi:hypothetical protein